MIDPYERPISRPMDDSFKTGDKFTNINDDSVVEVLRSMNGTVSVTCIKCHREGCTKELTYELEYFDRVFNPVEDIGFPYST